MIPCLTVFILSNDVTLLNTLATKAPAKIEASVWVGLLDEYTMLTGINIDNIPYLNMSIRFNRVEDRQLIWNKLNNALTTSVKSKLLSGSHIDFHDCNHDEDPRYKISGCGNVTTMWSK